MTITRQRARRGRYAFLGIAFSAVAAAGLAPLLPAQFLAAICNSLQDNVGSMLGLAIGLSMLAAFNLAFWRHFRRAYASPRRAESAPPARKWRGDR